MARGVRATTSWEGDELLVTPVGFWSKLRSVSGGIAIPFDCVEGASTTDTPRRYFRWWARVGGTSFPGLVQAGRFGFFQPRSFVVVGTARPVVIIVTNRYRYRYVLFSNDDPEATARKIQKAVERRA